MTIGEKYTINKKVVGAANKKQYALPGDRVEVVFISVPAVLVKDNDGNVFSTNVENLKDI